MLTKFIACYQEQPYHHQRCADCSMWRNPDACTLVQGTISPQGHCIYWEPVPITTTKLLTFSEHLLKREEKRTLLVKRPLKPKSATKLRDWATANGFDSTLPPEDMHVTIAYSNAPLLWSDIPPSSEDEINTRGHTLGMLGEGAVVLFLDAPPLHDRHNRIKQAGATWDYPEYHPHVTISYNKPSNYDQIQPYANNLKLGPEQWKEVNPNWKDEIVEC